MGNYFQPKPLFNERKKATDGFFLVSLHEKAAAKGIAHAADGA